MTRTVNLFLRSPIHWNEPNGRGTRRYTRRLPRAGLRNLDYPRATIIPRRSHDTLLCPHSPFAIRVWRFTGTEESSLKGFSDDTERGCTIESSRPFQSPRVFLPTFLQSTRHSEKVGFSSISTYRGKYHPFVSIAVAFHRSQNILSISSGVSKSTLFRNLSDSAWVDKRNLKSGRGPRETIATERRSHRIYLLYPLLIWVKDHDRKSVTTETYGTVELLIKISNNIPKRKI